MQADVRSSSPPIRPTHDGYLLGGFGTYGTDYTERAVVSQIGLGAFVPHQAVYAMTWSDMAGAALDGSSAYVLHLPTPPPTGEGWSLTVYTSHGALVADIRRPLRARRTSSNLTRNSDGSIDLYLQPTQPSTAAEVQNWLITPAGQGFEVMWRLFAPDPKRMSGIVDGTGWQPPAVTARS